MIYYLQKAPANTQGDANELQNTTVEQGGNKLQRASQCTNKIKNSFTMWNA